MNKTLHILFLSLLTAVCLGFAVCSDCGDDLYGGTANDYEINDYYTSLLRQDWNGESTPATIANNLRLGIIYSITIYK